MKANIAQNKKYYIKVTLAAILILSILELIYFLNFYSINYPYSPKCYGNDYFLKNNPLLIGAIMLSIILCSLFFISKTSVSRLLISFEAFIFILKIIFLKSYHFSCVILGWGFTDLNSYYMDLAGLTARTILIFLLFLNKKAAFYLILFYIIGYLFIRERLTFWLGCNFGLC